MIKTRLSTFTSQFGNVPAMAVVPTMDFDDPLVAAKDLIHIYGTTNKPVLVEILPEIVTVFNAGTTNVLTAGTEGDSGLDNIFAAGDIVEGAVGFGSKKYLRVSTSLKIQAKFAQTGDAATTGSARFYITVTPITPAA